MSEHVERVSEVVGKERVFPPIEFDLATNRGRKLAAGELLGVANTVIRETLYPVDAGGNSLNTSTVSKLVDLGWAMDELQRFNLREQQALKAAGEDITIEPASQVAYKRIQDARDRLYLTATEAERLDADEQLEALLPDSEETVTGGHDV